jgi:hypothetical protein
MLQRTKQFWRNLSGGTFRLILLAGAVLLGWGTLAPVGTIVWWLNQDRKEFGLQDRPSEEANGSPAAASARSANINCYIVFLPGVGDFSADQLTPGEEWLLNRLEEQYQNCVTVREVFPYSATNQDLNGERLLTPLWQAAEQADGWLENADILIKIRNLWRFAISADDRYGPVYNRGIANTIMNRMNAVHPLSTIQSYPPEVILIGTSGGAQVALGAVPYLDRWLNARLTVISLGGTFNGENGFERVDQVYHLQGERDWVEDITRILFPSRWPWTVGSPFNQAQRQERYIAMSSGPHTHDGEEGYFGTAIAQKPDTTYVEITLDKLKQLLSRYRKIDE